MSDVQMPALKSAINRGLDWGRASLTVREVAAAVQEDPALGMLALQHWQSRGWLRVEKDPFTSQPEDVCIVVHDYIDGDRPWSDPMSAKM